MKVVSAFQLLQSVLREIICKMAKQYLLRHIIKKNAAINLTKLVFFCLLLFFCPKLGNKCKVKS